MKKRDPGKIICTSDVNFFRAAPESFEISSSPNLIDPSIGSSSPTRVLPKVVLPHPDSPTSATVFSGRYF